MIRFLIFYAVVACISAIMAYRMFTNTYKHLFWDKWVAVILCGVIWPVFHGLFIGGLLFYRRRK